MTTVSISSKVAAYLDSIGGETPDDKLVSLLETYLAVQLRACEREIGEYEVKYRSTFSEFAAAWGQGQIADKTSHTVERDYMEWEGLEAEKQRWLERLRKLPTSGTPRPAGEK